jgi:hypothetical protein
MTCDESSNSTWHALRRSCWARCHWAGGRNQLLGPRTRLRRRPTAVDAPPPAPGARLRKAGLRRNRNCAITQRLICAQQLLELGLGITKAKLSKTGAAFQTPQAMRQSIRMHKTATRSSYQDGIRTHNGCAHPERT